MKKNCLELLAPAQNKECAITAIEYGADALYIGASAFGARKNASNSIEDIKEIINYAHKFNVKVYVTLNTILTDEELKQAKDLIQKLYEIKTDAIIVQDYGIFELDLPPVKIFASTQCDIRSKEKVKFFENIGVSRVILARELTVSEIKEICSYSDIEIETFVAGALCVSYSGQCYLSYAKGGRSANRGECAQACRKKYSLTDENNNIMIKDKHLLSLKDFSAENYLKELIESGVTSFKIEGRLKDVNYIKNVTGYYRKLIDKLAPQYNKTSSGSIHFDFTPDINKTFNRGFCDYFLSGKRKQIHNFDTPKARGEYIGKCIKSNKDYFIVETKERLNLQDGLCFMENDEFSGCFINKIESYTGNQYKIYPNKKVFIKEGALIYRNSDSIFESVLKKSKTKRRIDVCFKVFNNYIEAVDEDNIKVTVEFSETEIANNKEQMIQNYVKCLSKYSDSDFYVKKVEITASEPVFLTVAKINEIRRKAFNELINLRLKNYKTDVQEKIKPAKFIINKGDYRLNVLNESARTFLNKCGCEVMQDALESGISIKNKELMRCKYCLKAALNMCRSDKKLYLIDDKEKKYELKFDCKKCEMAIMSP